MEDGIVLNVLLWQQLKQSCLNPVVVEDGLVHDLFGEIMVGDDVLILVVVEDGLVPVMKGTKNTVELS